jgi:hypothetical protein
MKIPKTPILLMALLFSGNVALATPQDDAKFIANRETSSSSAWMENIETLLKDAFVTIYYKPIPGDGIQIADSAKFADLIPDEDIEPYIARLISNRVEFYLAAFSPEQLEALAAILRSSDDLTALDVLSKDFDSRHGTALEHARANNVQQSGSNDPLVEELEELTIRLDAFSATLEENGESLGLIVASSIAPVFQLLREREKIVKLERPLDNPVTVAAIKSEDILKFANPVQQRILIRQLTSSEKTGGIQFMKSPSGNAQGNQKLPRIQ